MIAESYVINSKTTIPKEILKKIGINTNVLRWNINKEGKIEIEVDEIPAECVQFYEELDKIEKDVESGNYFEGSPEELEEYLKQLGEEK